MGKRMDEASNSGMMELFMMEILAMIQLKAMEYNLGQIRDVIKENGNTVSTTETVNSPGQTVANTSDNSSTIKNTATESSTGQGANPTWACGIKGNNMAKV